MMMTMKPGDVVMFKDVSSFSDRGRGSFHMHDGKMGIVIEFKLASARDGNERVKVSMRDSVDFWSPEYFEVISEGG
jgi:hypothetical protein